MKHVVVVVVVLTYMIGDIASTIFICIESVYHKIQHSYKMSYIMYDICNNIFLCISVQFNESATKGKQMLPGGSKTRSALQTGYFQDKFGRILEGEAFSDPIKIRRQSRLKEGQKNIGKAFLPSSGEKQM